MHEKRGQACEKTLYKLMTTLLEVYTSVTGKFAYYITANSAPLPLGEGLTFSRLVCFSQHHPFLIVTGGGLSLAYTLVMPPLRLNEQRADGRLQRDVSSQDCKQDHEGKDASCLSSRCRYERRIPPHLQTPC
jgi:hypothetical protein